MAIKQGKRQGGNRQRVKAPVPAAETDAIINSCKATFQKALAMKPGQVRRVMLQQAAATALAALQAKERECLGLAAEDAAAQDALGPDGKPPAHNATEDELRPIVERVLAERTAPRRPARRRGGD